MKATYTFRGIDVLIFEDGELTFGEEANMCNFIDDDLAEMSNFLKDCWYYQRKEIEKVKNVEVN